MVDEVDVDPLDAYMATLDVGSADTREAPDAADWSAARHRSARATATTTRNRRFRRLQQLLAREDGGAEGGDDDGGGYFSDAMMQQRSPALFHFHLGQYLPAAAAAAPSSSATPDAELLLSTFLLRASDRREMEARRAWEQRAWGAFVAQDEVHARAREKALFQRDDVEEEEDDSSDEDDDNDEEETKQSERDASADAVSIDERRQLLVDLMAQRFLHGSDHEYVDYAAIDGDEALDDLEQMQRDAEDAYFDVADE